jgi:hypothetical protein
VTHVYAKDLFKKTGKSLTDFVQSINLKEDSQVPKQTFLLKVEKILNDCKIIIYSFEQISVKMQLIKD